MRFHKGKPSKFESATRNETGVADIRARGKWEPGWEIKLRVRFDAFHPDVSFDLKTTRHATATAFAITATTIPLFAAAATTTTAARDRKSVV